MVMNSRSIGDRLGRCTFHSRETHTVVGYVIAGNTCHMDMFVFDAVDERAHHSVLGISMELTD